MPLLNCQISVHMGGARNLKLKGQRRQEPGHRGTIIILLRVGQMSTLLYFIPNSRKSKLNSDINFCCTISLACINHSVICDISFHGAATSGIGLQRWTLTDADWRRIQWPWMTLNAKIRSFMDFWWFRAATQVYIIYKVAPRYYRYAIVAWIWYLYINLARTPQFLAKLLNRNCYRLSHVSWALAQISCNHSLNCQLAVSWV